MKSIIFCKNLLFSYLLVFTLTAVTGCTSSVQAPSASTNSGNLSATRIVHTIMGDVTVPTNPQRIVVNWYVGDVFTLGFKPAALAGWSHETMPFYDKFDGIPIIENWETEAILAHNPDLIITYNEEDYAKLSKIAPVIVVPETGMSSVERLMFLGNATGRKAEAEAAITAFEKKRDEAKKLLASDGFANKTFSIFQDWGSGSYGIYYETESRGGTLLYQHLGLKEPEKLRHLVETSKKTRDTLSYEVVADYAGDYVLWFLMDNVKSEFAETDVWRNIPAVRDGHLIEIPAHYSGLFFYSDVASMTAQLDYIVNKLRATADKQ